MKLKLQHFLLVGLLFSGLSGFSQEWVDMMRDPNANFYDIRAAFNAHWENRQMERGKGYKAFRRWEHYMAPRVYPSGNVTLASQALPNYRTWEMEQAAAGIPKSTNGNWSLIGPVGNPTGGGAGRINFVRFDPTNSTTMYVGAPDGGLWKTTNGGTSWTTNTDQLSVIGVSDIAIDPTNTQIMYLATGDADASDTYSVGVLKSTDGGTTWGTTGLAWTVTQGRNISRILVNPTNPQIVMAFASNGIWRSTNGGTTWTQPTGTFNGIMDAEFKPGDPTTVYAAGTVFKKSTDSGATWTAVTTGLTGIGRLAIAVTAANPSYVYVLAAKSSDSGFLGLIRSTNSGTSFSTRSTTPNVLGWDNGADSGGQGWYDLAIAASPTDAEVVFIGGINIWKSTNGGTAWTLNSHWYGGYSKPYVHADIHDLAFLPGSGTTLFAGTDGGVSKTTNTGTNWSDITANLAIAQQYRIGLSTSNANLIIAGHQDNGTNRYNGTAWAEVYGGDGMDCFIDRTNNNVMVGSYVYGEYYRSTNGGGAFTSINSGLPAGNEWLSVIHQDPVTAATYYAGGRTALYRTTNSGTGWSALGTPTGSGSVMEFAVAPSNNQIIYAAKQGTNAISKSTNGGTSFTAVSSLLPTAVTPTYIAVSNTDPNVVFVTYSGYNASNKVYKSINGGTSWTNLSTGLPNVPVNCVVYQNGSADAIYIGTDIGVFYRDNTTGAWIEFSTGLPRTQVSDLEIYYATGRLRAATYGRGTWDSDLYSSVPSAPVASFTGTPTSVCLGQTVSFTSTSSGNPTGYAWTFTGGTPSTSVDQNPTVTYNTAGTFTVALTVTNANGNNTSTQSNYVNVLSGNGSALPFTEGFVNATFPPVGWSLLNTDGGATTWSRSATVGFAPTAPNSMLFDNANFDDTGNEDEMRTPRLDFSGLTSAQLLFDVAYAPYDITYSDGLEVLISADCGTTFTSVYSKSGTTLATAPATTGLFTPSAAQWRTETVNLTPYAGQTNLIVAFRNLAGYGNRLFVDNINISGAGVPTPPVASFSSTPSSTVCSGQTVQYTNTSTGSPTSYAWTFEGGSPATSIVQSPSVTYANAGVYDVTLLVTNGSGNNTSTQPNYITVNQTPSISGTTPANRCGNGVVTLGATASTGTISWYSASSGGSSLGTGASFNTPSISTNTTYYVEVTANGCTSGRTPVIATIKPVPTVNDPANQTLCLTESTSNVTFSGSSGSSTYAWTNNNTSVGLAASGNGAISSFTPTAAGTATVTVTPTLNGCPGTTQSFTILVEDCLAIDEEDPSYMSVYPNPSAGLVSIEGAILMEAERIELIDEAGRIVKSWETTNSKMQLDLSEFAVGNYTIQLVGENQKTTRKIQIVR